MTSSILVLAWLVLAHLLADFVFQSERIATDKFGRDVRAWRALLAHVTIVAAFTAPLILVFGLPGLAYVLVTAVTHLFIDRAKILVMLRAEPVAPSTDEHSGGLVAGWTPMPGVWFLLDQLAHLGVLVVAWAILLSGASPLDWWTDLLAQVLRDADLAVFHTAVLICVVVAALVVANVRAGSMFVATLVRAPRPPVVEDTRPPGPPSEARIGATIGVVERLLICALVLAGGVMTIGLVVAAKTIARFKQLDDRDFAEYYLMGTLSSVAFAVVTSLVAQRALA